MKKRFKDTKEKAQQLAEKAKNLAKQVKEKPVNTFIRIATAHPIITIGLVILITIAIIPGVLRIELDNNIRGFLGSEFDTVIETNYVEEMFHISKSIFFLTVESNNIYTTETLEYIKLLHNQLSADINSIDAITTYDGTQYNSSNPEFVNIIKNTPDDIKDLTINGVTHNKTKAVTKEMIKEVNSIINAVDATSDGQSLETFDFIKERYNPSTDSYHRVIPKEQTELNELERLLEDNKDYSGLYYSQEINENGYPSAWIFTVEINDESHDDYYEIIDYIEETIYETKNYGYETKLFGVDYTNRKMNEESQEDVKTQILIVAFVMMVVFFLNFRTPTGVIVPEINTIISVFWVFGLMGYFGVKFSIIGLLILPVLFAVTSSYSIHSLNQYYKEMANKKKISPNDEDSENHKQKSKKIADSMSHILTTIAIAGLTTFVSLVSLIGSNIIHIKTFGIFAGIGVILSVVLSITFIPAILVIAPQKAVGKKKSLANFNNTFMDKAIRKTIAFIIKHRYFVFIVFLLLGIGFITGIYFISTDSSFVMMFDSDHKIRQLSKHFSEHTGGVTTMLVTIDAAPELDTSIKNTINDLPKEYDSGNEESPIENDQAKDPFKNDSSTPVNDPFSEIDGGNTVEDPFEDNGSDTVEDPFDEDYSDTDEAVDYEDYFGEEDEGFEDTISEEKYNNVLNSELLKKIDSMSEYIESLENVGRVYSYVDIIKRLHYVYNGKTDREKFESIPDTDMQIKNYKAIFQGDDDNEDDVPDSIENLVDPTYNKMNMIITLTDKGNVAIDTGDYDRIEDRISKHIEDNFKDMGIEYYITGWSILHKDVQEEIVRGQIISIMFSFFVIFLIISILFRSPLSGLISIIPLSASILVTMGLMGYMGIPLDIATALISAVAIGIAVDDTIHYMLYLRKFKNELGENLDIETLVYKTTSFTSKAIIFTSIALIFGFLVLMFSTFIPIRQFAYLTAFTLFIATVATLWALPSVFLIFPRLVGIKKKSGKEVMIDTDKDF